MSTFPVVLLHQHHQIVFYCQYISTTKPTASAPTLRAKLRRCIKECPPSVEFPPPGSFYVTDRTDRTWIVDALKKNLKSYEITFKSQYCYGTTAYGSTDPSTGTMEVRHCITALSDKTISWKGKHFIVSILFHLPSPRLAPSTTNLILVFMGFDFEHVAPDVDALYSLIMSLSFENTEKSSGIMWVGVYGLDDICVVTLSGHVDRKRVRGVLASTSPKSVLSIFRKCVLSELEDPSNELCGKLQRSFDTPFCVVSATPGTAETLDESGHETSSSVAHADDAVSFVRGSGLLEQAKDSGGAIKLAISAFERLMGKKFGAEEIEVTVLFGRNFGGGYIRDLDVSEIGDYLAAVEAI